MNFQKGKKGSVLPTVLVAVLLLEVLLLGSLHVYRTQSYSYNLLINHYQSQAILSYGEILLTTEKERYGQSSKGVITFTIGKVSFTTVDSRQYELTSQLLNGYQEKQSFTVQSP